MSKGKRLFKSVVGGVVVGSVFYLISGLFNDVKEIDEVLSEDEVVEDVRDNDV